MYMKTEAERVVRIPPADLSESIDSVIDKRTWESFEGKFGPDKGLVVLIDNVRSEGPGRIVHGDGAVYQTVKFDQLVFFPKENEIIDGTVVDVVTFGAFVKIGPLDGLLHISQIADDVFDVDVSNKRIVGREKGKVLSVGDKIRVRIVSVNLNEKDPQGSKIGLTTKQPGLGRPEWIQEEASKGSEA